MSSRWFQHPFCRAFLLAHLMREAFPEHWLRIHSLPESKRYPDGEVKREIVLTGTRDLARHYLGITRHAGHSITLQWFSSFYGS